MERDIRVTYPGERSIILAEQRREWRAGLGAVVVVVGTTMAAWLALSAPEDISGLKASVVPAAEAATMFADQPKKLNLYTGTKPIEVADQSAPQDNTPLAEGDIVKLQSRLKSLGFDPGKADGHAGKRTLQALNAYRKSLGLQPVPAIDRQAVAPLNP